MPDVPLSIDEVEGRPVVVLERPPDRVVAVDRDWILNPHVVHGSTNVLDVLLEWKLGRVHPDHDQAVVPVLCGPGMDVGYGAQPVDAGVGPELDEDDLSAQAVRRQWRGVEPLDRAAE